MAPHPAGLPYLETERLVLRLPEEWDVDELLRYHRENAEHLIPWTPRRPADFDTREFWVRQIEEIHREYAYGLGVRFTLFARDPADRIVGNASLSAILRGIAQFCYLGYGIAREHQGQGLMHEALQAVIPYAFDELGLHRIMANYMPSNERSGRLLTRLGFEREGLAKSYLRINGEWEDHVLNALVNPGWRAPS